MRRWVPSVSDVRARLLKSAGWLLARQLVMMVNSLVLGVLIARHLGPGDFGVLSYAVSLVVIAMPLTTLGLRNLSLREYASRPDDTPRILGTITAMRLAGTLVAIAAIYGTVTLFPIDHDRIAVLCLILAGALLFQTIDTIKEQFIAEQNPRPFVIVNVCVLLVFSVVRIALILTDMPVDAFILAQAGETVAQGVFAGVAYSRFSGRPPRLQVDFRLMRTYARHALPLMLGSISAVIYLKIDILFLASMVGTETTGLYAVAARLSEAWYLLPASLAMAAFPRMLQVRTQSPARYEQRMQDAMDLFAAFGTAVAVSSIFWARPLIDLLFGAEYIGAVPLLQIYVWVGIVFATRELIHKSLLVEERYWGSAIINLTGAGTNVVLNLLLIPPYGAIGAAIATVLSYTLAPLLLAPLVPAIRPIAMMQLRAIFWPRRIPGLIRRGFRG
ncbi:flippase [Oceaniglobus indicus]|uniref:flippase n=1 Tax=Oceaniglobus indicus TaxID=2047749 RepID=UPI000C17679B|nr:flippase [Oceaniglobus indicus]